MNGNRESVPACGVESNESIPDSQRDEEYRALVVGPSRCVAPDVSAEVLRQVGPGGDGWVLCDLEAVVKDELKIQRAGDEDHSCCDEDKRQSPERW